MHLTLSGDDARDTVITNSHGHVIFKTSTPWSLTSRTTTIRKVRPGFGLPHNFDIISEIRWHSLSSTKFRFNGVEVAAKEFIPAKGFTRRKRAFVGPDGRSYKWKLGSHSLTLELRSGINTTVARYHKRSWGIIGKSHHPYLEVFPVGEPILDTIVLTFVYVHKLWRDKQKAADVPAG